MESRKRPDLHRLSANVPAPVDDRACDHLPGARVPPVRLQSTAGQWVDERIWDPVFPPGRDAETVLAWLGERARTLARDRGEARLA